MITEVAYDSAGSGSTARLETALCAALAVFLLWKGLIPAWRSLNTDFPNYYLVARLFREGYRLDRIYDWIWLQRIKDYWGLDQPLVGFAGLTPWSALPIVPLSIFSALTAKRIWILINLAILASSVELLHRSTALGRRRIWLVALLAVLPLRTSFLYGQMHLLVLFLMVLAYVFHRRGRAVWCGVCIALAGALKIYPLLFVLFFLWKRQWHTAAATMIAAGILVFAAGGTMGWGLLHTYMFEILPRSVQGEMLDPYNLHAASAAAVFHRLFLFEPSLNPAPALASSTLYAVLYPLWEALVLFPLFALIRPLSGPLGEQAEWAAFTFALLLLSPVPSSYHFVVMILPVVLLIDGLVRENRRGLIAISILLYLLVSVSGLIATDSHTISGLNTVLATSRLWFGIALYITFLIWLCRHSERTGLQHERNRYVLLVMLTGIALASSIASYRHHFLKRERETGGRLTPPAATLLATQPRADFSHNLFVAMSSQGYRISDADGPVLYDRPYRRFTDQLSFTVSADHRIFAEVADSSGSRIVRGPDLALIAEDAESPAISLDRDQLAFIREHKGQGSLWTMPLRSEDSLGSTLPVRLTGEDYDVRGLSFLRSGALLFLAKHEGSTGLFSIKSAAAPSLFFSPGAEIASFSVSPDEGYLALTERIHNRWQLAILDVPNRRIKLLTTTDCNAYTPEWSTKSSIIYATDCGRGVGLTALATVDISAALP
ncbi:DUF2029 domain-containing protein [Edaphobacter sp. HDX4]|uniref:glycosyltransferase 87 family protein n=1 Tax=Edaphobacter sp. HDX4 TaxID=2794064 RepID=UPI002FE5F20B